MNMNLIPMTTDIQSHFGMSAYGHASFRATGAACFAPRTIDLTQGEVGLKPATVTRKGWVQGTYAWRPPTV